jgi:tRNA threonylcarbamoyladenosine biosynthesis protein TsaE
VNRVLETHSEAETSAAGRSLAEDLQPGDVVLLSGVLGAGKTAFVRGLAEGLGADPASVSSPTFTIIQEYAGAIRIQHVDLYRLTPVEVEDLGLDDLLSGAVMAVEWPERWLSPPAGAIHVSIEPGAGDHRTIRFSEPEHPSP